VTAALTWRASVSTRQQHNRMSTSRGVRPTSSSRIYRLGLSIQHSFANGLVAQSRTKFKDIDAATIMLRADSWRCEPSYRGHAPARLRRGLSVQRSWLESHSFCFLLLIGERGSGWWLAVDFEFLRPEVNAAFSYEQMAAGHPSTSADVQGPRDPGKITD
jgi:hypothetical protein